MVQNRRIHPAAEAAGILLDLYNDRVTDTVTGGSGKVATVEWHGKNRGSWRTDWNLWASWSIEGNVVTQSDTVPQ